MMSVVLSHPRTSVIGSSPWVMMEGEVGGAGASEWDAWGLLPSGLNVAWLLLASLASGRCLTWQGWVFLCGRQPGDPSILCGRDRVCSLWRGKNG